MAELVARLKIVQFLAIVLTALALLPSGAHLFALPNKRGLAADQYFIVQNITAAGASSAPFCSEHSLPTLP